MSRREKLFLVFGFIALLLVLSGVVVLVRPTATETASLPTLAQLPSETPTEIPSNTVTAAPSATIRPTDAPTEADPATATASPTATPFTPTAIPTATDTPQGAALPPDTEIVSVVLPEPEPLPPPAEDTVVITFAPDATQAEREAYVDALGAEVVETVDALDTVVVRVADEIVASGAADNSVILAAEPDYYASVLQMPAVDDPLAPQQYGLATMGLAEAWAALPADAQQIVVAVIDTGICAAHPDLAGRVLPGYDFVDEDADPNDEHGHGCAVSGIIGAVGNNALGIAGVAPNAQILPLRVLNGSGLGTYSDIAQAIVYAADNGARVINLSLGGFNPGAVLENAVNYALERGALVVAAGGNTFGGQMMYPAAYPQLISVSAHDRTLLPASFNPAAPADVLAPGVAIPVLRADGGFETQSGTSFAAPHVSGALAVLLALGGDTSFGGAEILYLGSESPVPALTPSPSPEPASTNTPAPEGTPETISGISIAEPRPSFPGLTSELSDLVRAYVFDEAQAQSAIDQAVGLQISGTTLSALVFLVSPADAGPVTQAIERLGGNVVDVYADLMEANIPIDQLTTAATLPGVRGIDANRPPVIYDDALTFRSQAEGEDVASAQAVTQGVSVSNASAWHAANYRGQGIKIAVIDAGFFDYTGRQSMGELPAGAGLVNYTGVGTGGTTHGTNVAEIVHDMAPAATIYIAVPSSPANFGTLVQSLACNEGVRVIQSSIGWFGQTAADGSGGFADSVAAARACGALYVQSAGNSGVNHWDTVASSANFSSNIYQFGAGDPVNMFINSDGTCYQFSAGSLVTLALRWSAWPFTNQDYNLFIMRNALSNGTGTWSQVIISGGTNSQTGSVSSIPREYISATLPQAGCHGFLIAKTTTATGNHTLSVLGNNMPRFEYLVQERSLIDEATAANSVAVAALHVGSPYNREFYSSWGPAYAAGHTINNGAAIQQPRIAGYANVSTSFGSFNGTSAAAPHVAGAAALVFGAYPSYTPAQVLSFLESNAVPGGGDTAGYDTIYGFGRLYLGSLPATPSPTFTRTPSVTLTPSNTPIPTPGPNLVTNGTFDSGLTGWSFSNVAAGVSNGALYFNQWSPTQTVPGDVHQVVNVPHVAGHRYEMWAQVWNSSSESKVVTLQVRTSTSSTPAFACSFTLAPNAPPQQYVMRYQSTSSFPTMRISLLVSGNSSPRLNADDVVMRENNTLGTVGVECPGLATATPTNTPSPTRTFTPTNTFTATHTSSSTFTPTNSVTATHTFTPSSTFTVTNTPSSTFTSTPSSTLTSTHTASASFTPSQTHTRTPTFTPSNTPNATPGPNLVTNGTFDSGLTGWSFSNVAAGVSNGALYFNQWSPTQTVPGDVHQVVNVPHVAGHRYEMWARVWNSSSESKVVTLQVRTSTSSTPAFACSFTLAPNAPPQQYVMRYQANSSFPTMRISLLVSGNSSPRVNADDVVMRENNALGTVGVECPGLATATPTNTPSPTNTPTNTHTASASFTPTNTVTATHTLTPSNTFTPTNTATSTHTASASFTPSRTHTRTPTFTPSNTPNATPGPNLVTNGTFDSGLTGWSFSNVAAGVSNGALYFNQWSPTQTVPGDVYQVVNVPHVAGNRYEMRARVWNSSTATKVVTLQVRTSTSSTPAFACSITLAPNAPPQDYVMRYQATSSFPTMRISLLVSGNSSPRVNADNVVMRENNGLSTVGIECEPVLTGFASVTSLIAVESAPVNNAPAVLPPTATLTPSWTPQPPPGPNLAANGAFDADLTGWSFQGLAARWENQAVVLSPAEPSLTGLMYQVVPAPVNAGQPYEMLLQLANSDDEARSVTLMVRDASAWRPETTFMCATVIPPNTPLSTYTLRWRSPVSFTGLVAALWVQGSGTYALQADNVIVRTNPNLRNTGTECTFSGLGFTDALIPPMTIDQGMLDAWATAWATPTPTPPALPTLLPTATATPTVDAPTAEPPTSEPSPTPAEATATPPEATEAA